MSQNNGTFVDHFVVVIGVFVSLVGTILAYGNFLGTGRSVWVGLLGLLLFVAGIALISYMRTGKESISLPGVTSVFLGVVIILIGLMTIRFTAEFERDSFLMWILSLLVAGGGVWFTASGFRSVLNGEELFTGQEDNEQLQLTVVDDE